MDYPDTVVSPGMEVVGDDGEHVGRVKAVLAGGFVHVDCPLSLDCYIPADAVKAVEEGKIILRCSKTQAANMGWEARPAARD